MSNKYEYFDGREKASIDELSCLAEIMNRTNNDPDSVQTDAEKGAIVRAVFKMAPEASDQQCLSLWNEFLTVMYIRGICEED